ncbi:MAG: BamA/TamA family outer membrane protein [Paludibacteraceae bacterium]|nr:BamA/TamA family outer membrane protein [Paludibacteraceae bacterium]
MSPSEEAQSKVNKDNVQGTMHKGWSLLWRVPLALTGVLSGLVLLLLIAVAGVILTPSARQAVINKGIEIANEQTGWNIDLGRIYLSPFHHSPMALYRAYKGEEDLSLQVEIDSLFVGHRGKDTLVYTRSLRLRATALTTRRSTSASNGLGSLLAVPIVVEQLLLDKTAFHSDSLIASVEVNVDVGNLDVSSPGLVIADGLYPLHGLRLTDADVGVDLRSTAKKDTVQKKPLRLAFDIQDGKLSNVHFRLTPLGLDINTDYLGTNVLVDVGADRYDVQRIDVGGFALKLGKLRIPADTIYGNACADVRRNLITSNGLHVRSDEWGAKADVLTTALDLNTMRIDVKGDAEYKGSRARLRASYGIDDEAYDATVHIERVNLAPFLQDSTPIIIAGDIEAVGQGINPHSRAMKGRVDVRLTDAIYGPIDASGLHLNARLANQTVDGTLHLPFAMHDSGKRIQTQSEHQFRVSDFMNLERIGVDYHTQMRNLSAHIANRSFYADSLNLDFSTDSLTSLGLLLPGLRAHATSPMHVSLLLNSIQSLVQAVGDTAKLAAITSLQDLTMLDTLHQLMPALNADMTLLKGSPLQPIIDSAGIDISEAAMTLTSDSSQTILSFNAATGEQSALRLPPAQADLRVTMSEGRSSGSLKAATRLTDGAMSVHDLKTDAAMWFDVERTGNELNGRGSLTLDELAYNTVDLGSRTIDFVLSPSDEYPHALKADVQLDDIPLDLVDSILRLSEFDFSGVVRAQASVDGMPKRIDVSANVLPLGVEAHYKPYGIGLSLGETPIIMKHNRLDLNGLPIYGADSTFVTLKGGLNLDSLRLNIVLEADSFAPVKLIKNGPIPVYGDLASDVRGSVTGPIDGIVADVDLTLLPTTDITYQIDKKNLAQVKPYGTVNVRYDVAQSELNLGGQVNVDHGIIRYSPKMYPIIPFHIDSGSNITFQGPIGKTKLNVSASQKVKADVESRGEETRRVDFTTGVRVSGIIDSIGIRSIGFFLEAPNDDAVSQELASVDDDTREGLAAALLATGMYMGESNVAAQRAGYTLSSIINSRINAAMDNSKIGKFIDVDISSGQTNHAVGKTNDMNIAISKSFFKDKLRVTVGSTISDNPEVNKTNGLLTNLTADYKLTKNGSVMLRLFAQRDYNNILEGELYKSGLSVMTTKEWRHSEHFRGDSISRTYNLTADAGLAYRSNNSIGPNLTLKSSIKNLMGRGETFTIKANGAYYWALRNRHPGDPKKTDTYKLGVNAALVFPYLHWKGDNNPDGDTRYMLGYQYENIAGGYGLHKISGSLTYFIRSPFSPYVVHSFTPLSLAVVRMKAESASLMDKAAEYPQLIRLIAGNEFSPSVGYTFTYNDFRAKRPVNTMLELGVKESGNLLNSIYCAFGHKWNEKGKPFGGTTFNQYVKFTAELRHKFNLTERICFVTRLYAGANIPVGNSDYSPLSEAFYTGGPNSLRASAPYAYGPGNFYSAKYNQSFFHAGDIKLEANFEFRFPIVWKLYGAAFVDAGNVWNWYSMTEQLKAGGFEDYITRLELPEDLHDGILDNPDIAHQIALGTGLGLRLDLDGLVIRLDVGVGIHSPYQTYKYDKDGKIDKTRPINTYFNIPSALDALRLNFGIGYPF